MTKQSDPEQLSIAAIISLTMLVYFPTVFNGFTNWDDGYHLVNNPIVKSLSWESLHAMFTSFTVAHYIPLVLLSFAIEFHFFGLDPFVFHFTSLLLHVISTILVFALMRRWKFSVGTAFLTALIFGVHPLHVEAVAWISARKDVLAGVFLLGSLLTYLRADESGTKVHYGASLFLFLCSLGAKSAGVFLPVVLLVRHAVNGELTQRRILRILPFILMSAAASWFTIAALDEAGGLHLGLRYTAVETVMVACYNILFYTVKIIAPFGLSSVYPFPDARSGFSVEFMAAPFVVFVLFVLLYRYRHSIGTLIVPLTFFAAGLVPTLQIITFGSMIAADRFAYLPMLGLLIVLASLAERYVPDTPAWRRAVIVISVTIVALFSVMTWNRITIWKESETLWTDAIQRYPEFPISYYSRGQHYFASGEHGRAYDDFSKALEYAPNYPNALNMRGYLNALRGERERARADFDKVIALEPTYALAYYNRGLLHQAAGRIDSAKADFSTAIQNDSTIVEALVQRGSILIGEDRHEAALVDLTSALRLTPDHAEAWRFRGTAFLNLSRLDESLRDLTTAIRIDPEDRQAYRLLSILYQRKGMADSASIYFELGESASP